MNIFKNKESSVIKENFKKKLSPSLKKSKSSLRCRNIKNSIKEEIDKETTFGKHRGSVQEPQLNLDSRFIDNAALQVNKNHNLVSRSLGKKNIFSQNKLNIDPSIMKFEMKPSKRVFRNSIKEKFMSSNMPERKNLHNNNIIRIPHQFCTLDNRDKSQRICQEKPLGNRMKASSSMQRINLPQIN